jgi:hypothetical protein
MAAPSPRHRALEKEHSDANLAWHTNLGRARSVLFAESRSSHAPGSAALSGRAAAAWPGGGRAGGGGANATATAAAWSASTPSVLHVPRSGEAGSRGGPESRASCAPGRRGAPVAPLPRHLLPDPSSLTPTGDGSPEESPRARLMVPLPIPAGGGAGLAACSSTPATGGGCVGGGCVGGGAHANGGGGPYALVAAEVSETARERLVAAQREALSRSLTLSQVVGGRDEEYRFVYFPAIRVFVPERAPQVQPHALADRRIFRSESITSLCVS